MGVNLALKHPLGLQHEDCSVRDTITRVLRSTRESTSSKRGPNPIPLVRKARDLLNKDIRNAQTALLTRPSPRPWHRKDTSQNLAKTCKWTGYTFLSHPRTLSIRLIQQSQVPTPGYGYPVIGWAPLITGLPLSSSPNCSDEWSTQRPQISQHLLSFLSRNSIWTPSQISGSPLRDTVKQMTMKAARQKEEISEI